MELDVHYPRDGVAVIRAVGRLNMVAAPRLRELVTSTVTEQGRAQVVIDLTGTEFIDSSGLGALIAGLRVARTAGGDLKIAGASGQVTDVLELTKLDRVLRPYPTVAECLT